MQQTQLSTETSRRLARSEFPLLNRGTFFLFLLLFVECYRFSREVVSRSKNSVVFFLFHSLNRIGHLVEHF
ncbi:ORF202 [White spot syndrome virus]|uniref:ORF202 n=1 Tax=White spot syndrome virus TaxID=342409 RepID=A0A2D3I6I1_9VIRU|nr:ORF202 [White spot syndrome virus]